MNRLLTISLVALLFAACQRTPPRSDKPAAAGPKMRVTIATISTTVQPGNRTYAHSLIFTDDRARSGDEVDSWRLFDIAKNQVTFVDDVAKSYRTVSYADLAQERHRVAAQPLPEGLILPHATITETHATRTLNGFSATESIVRLGAYERHVWLSSKTSIPARLFALMLVSDNTVSPYASLTRAVDEALLQTKGFPLLDHAELPYEKSRMIVDHTVTKLEQKDVPLTWLNVPANYRDDTKKAAVTTPAARPPAASSPAPDRKTPAAE
jgi:hypothetical protein